MAESAEHATSKKTLMCELNCTVLYCTVLYYTILYYTILYYTILYYTILHRTYHTLQADDSSVPIVSQALLQYRISSLPHQLHALRIQRSNPIRFLDFQACKYHWNEVRFRWVCFDAIWKFKIMRYLVCLMLYSFVIFMFLMNWIRW